MGLPGALHAGWFVSGTHSYYTTHQAATMPHRRVSNKGGGGQKGRIQADLNHLNTEIPSEYGRAVFGKSTRCAEELVAGESPGILTHAPLCTEGGRQIEPEALPSPFPRIIFEVC
jgi:hypothetical protein